MAETYSGSKAAQGKIMRKIFDQIEKDKLDGENEYNITEVEDRTK